MNAFQSVLFSISEKMPYAIVEGEVLYLQGHSNPTSVFGLTRKHAVLDGCMSHRTVNTVITWYLKENDFSIKRDFYT